MLSDFSENTSTQLRDLKSLCGKLIDIRCLSPDFKFHLGNLIMDSSLNGTDLTKQVKLSDWTHEDLRWWKTALPVMSSGKIQNPDM